MSTTEAIQIMINNYSIAGANLLDWLDEEDIAAMPNKYASEQQWRDWGNDVACRATFRALRQAKDAVATKSDTSTDSMTKPVMSIDVLRVIHHLLKYSNPIGVIGDMWRDHALKFLQRPEAPTDGRCVWYRGWECCPDSQGMAGQIGGWHACLGGADADCISVDALTWGELLDEIDEHDMTEAARAALTEPTDG